MTFKELLKSKDMTASRLSRKIGVSRESVGNWVHGRNVPKNILIIEKIATALETDVETVLNSLSMTAKK